MLVQKNSSTKKAETSLSAETSPAPRKRFGLGASIIALLALAGFGIFNFEVQSHNQVISDLRGAEIQARVAGIPTSAAELDALMPQVPDAQNAESDYLQMIKLKEQHKLKQPFVTTPEAPYQLLDSQKELLKLVRQASDRKGLNFKHDWSDILTSWPEVGVAREGAVALAVSAEVSAFRGDTTNAIQDLKKSYRIRDQLAAQPLLISQLCASIDTMQIDQAALGIASKFPSMMGPILDLIKANEFKPSFPKTFQGEAFLSVNLIRLIKDFRDLQAVKSGQYDQAMMDRLQANANQPLSDFQKRALIDLYRGWSEIFSQVARDPNAVTALDGMLRDENLPLSKRFLQTPMLGQYLQLVNRAKVHKALLEGAVSVLNYRTAHGGVLPPTVPPDAGPNYKAVAPKISYYRRAEGFTLQDKTNYSTLTVNTGMSPASKGVGK